MNETYAVLTGDVIDSRKLSASQLEVLFGNVRDLWKSFGKVHSGAVVGTLEVFRGDGWQAALAKPALCVEAAVFLRAAFRAQPGEIRVDSRIGIGVGMVERLDPDRLSESNGPAFQRSGEMFEVLDSTGLRWGLGSANRKNEIGSASIILPMMDLLVQRWTQPEAAAVVGTLLGLTQAEIAAYPLAAKKNGAAPTQQAVAKVLKRIGWKYHWRPVLTKVQGVLEKTNQGGCNQ